MMTPEPNEIRPEILSTLALQPFKTNTSASRDQMVSSHLGQHLVIEGGTERYFQTGYEREFGRYTFAKRMPFNGKVISVIERYARTHGEDAIKYPLGTEVPEIVAIIENDETKEIGCIRLPTFCSQHQYFGFRYSKRAAMGKLRPGLPIGGGEIFLDSPAITENGGYKYGAELNVAYMSIPGVSEDGIAICEDKLDVFTFSTFETRVVEFGSKQYPLPIFGENKIFPDLGEAVGPDGMLMALRSYDPMLACVEMGVEDVKQGDPFFDSCTYVGAGGIVRDIRIFRQNNMQPQTPEQLEAQPMRYDRARRQFYQEVINEWTKLKRDAKGSRLQLTPEFDDLVKEAISVVGTNTTAPNEVIKLLYRQNPIDEWRIEFTVEFRMKPAMGVKLTDVHGGKGVIVKILKRSEMPVDENGVSADAIFDGGATIARMIPGRLYEHYFNAASRDLVRNIAKRLNVAVGERDLFKKLSRIEDNEPQLIDEVWRRLMEYYEILSPRLFAIFGLGEYHGSRLDHLNHVIKQGMLHIWFPTDNEPEPSNMVRQLKARGFRPHIGPVRYIGNSGNPVITEEPVLIGSVYVMLLEKIADDGTAVASGRYQHHGVLSPLNASDKHATPYRMQPVRAMGESEERAEAAYCGTYIIAEMNDWNNNPFTHRHMVYNLLNSEKPTAIPRIVDRVKIPLGGAKPLQLVSHIMQVGGLKLKYEHPRVD